MVLVEDQHRLMRIMLPILVVLGVVVLVEQHRLVVEQVTHQQQILVRATMVAHTAHLIVVEVEAVLEALVLMEEVLRGRDLVALVALERHQLFQARL